MEDQNKLDWETYEFITKYIYETLYRDYKINIEGYGRNCKIKGNSGVIHQIDVLTSEIDGTNKYRTAIECKYLNKKVNKNIVMTLLAIINDTDIQRGIIISKSGYTQDAQQFARHHNILIVQLREVGKKDEKLKRELHIGNLQINTKINRKRPEVTNIIAINFDDIPIKLNEKDQYNIFVKKLNGNMNRLFDEIMVFKEYLNEQKPFETVTKKYDHQQTLLYLQDNIQKIKSITYTGLLTVQDMNEKKIFSIVDKVWLVMEKIFEEETFIISTGGLIIQNLDRK